MNNSHILHYDLLKIFLSVMFKDIPQASYNGILVFVYGMF